jgi:hypothetical protein
MRYQILLDFTDETRFRSNAKRVVELKDVYHIVS